MLLRPRQQEFSDNCVQALLQRQQTIGIAPTGAGKTVMLSDVIRQMMARGSARVLVLQHREELIKQNRATFRMVAGPDPRIGTINADIKQYDADVLFASVQTLCRPENLASLEAIDGIATDEAHHAVAPSYRRIYERFPEAWHLGVTATPGRGDRQTLRGIFDNVADHIALNDLIRTGVLVPPDTYVVDVGVSDQLDALHKPGHEYDLDAVADVLNQPQINRRVVEEWAKVAKDRQTVAFCSNLAHVESVLQSFLDANVNADSIDGSMNQTERAAVLSRFEQGDCQVLVNCGVLTEGWDCQTVSCVLLLRPFSFQSTMIQMIGRGLRRLDPLRHPGRPPKVDCVVIDFGASLLKHGTLEQDPELEAGKVKHPYKTCPACFAEVPLACRECPLCGYEFTVARSVIDGKPAREVPFSIRRIDLFNQSPFPWQELWNGAVLAVTSFNAWAVVLRTQGQWHAIGGIDGVDVRLLGRGDQIVCLCQADDFMRAHANRSQVAKGKAWLHLPMTEKQRPWVTRLGGPETATRYQGACYIAFGLNEAAIKMTVREATDG